MSNYLDEHSTTPIPASPVAPGSFSPAELADVLAISGSSDVRAAFAAGLSSALLPVLTIATVDMDSASTVQRVAYLASLTLLAVAMVFALATFLEVVALRATDALAWIRRRTVLPLGDAVTRGARGALRSREAKRLGDDSARPGALDYLLDRLARPRSEVASLPPRVRRATAKAVASQCAATLAVFGAAIAAAGWMSA